MLNFFRRIRQKLLSEGKPKKYLIYSLGEIALVVIGIVIGLAVNSNIEKARLNLRRRYTASHSL